MGTITERLEILITSNARDAVDGLKSAETSFGGLGSKLTDFDDKMAGTNAKLQSLGMQGISTGTIMAAGIGLGVTAMAGFGMWAEAGIDKQIRLADSIRGVSEASGLAVDDAARLIEVTGDYGVEVEAVEGAMFKLATNVANSKDKFAEHGVEIAKNKDGTVDLLGTLENIQGAYLATGDATERDALLMDLFGRKGKDLIPVLERTGDLARALSEVPESRILSQGDLDNAQAYKLAMDDLRDAMDALQRAVGAALIPTLTDLATAVTGPIEGLNEATASVGGLGAVLQLIPDATPLGMPLHALGAAGKLMGGDIRGAGEEAVRGLGLVGDGLAGLGEKVGIFKSGSDSSNEFADAQKRVAEATREVMDLASSDSASASDLKAAKKELADAQAALADKTRDVAGAMQSENEQQQQSILLADQRIGGLLGLASADLSYQGAVASRQAAEEKLNGLIQQGTTSGAEYEAATRAVEQADIAVVGAALAVESQVRSLTAQVKDGSLSHEDYTARVNELKARYPELGAAIDAVTGQVMTHHREIDAVPTDHNTNFTATDNVSWMVDNIRNKVSSVFTSVSGTLSAIAGATEHRAAGGPVSANSMYLVGERGPEPFVPRSSGTIIPNHRVGGGGNNYSINVQVAPGGSPADTGRAIVEAIRAYEDRSGGSWRAA